MNDKCCDRNTVRPISKDLTKLLSKNFTNIVITGDSLAYNRYDFEPDRKENAYNCYPGILSWSFMLRDAIYQNDKWYIFGDEINYKQSKIICGNGKEFNYINDKYSCLNHGKIATLVFDNANQTNSFLYSHLNPETNKIVLYMQRRPDNYSCIFDIYSNDSLALSDIDNIGNVENFKGWELFTVHIPLPGDGKIHEISFRNIRNITNTKKAQGIKELKNTKNVKSLVTIAGIGTKDTGIHLTGCGGKTTYFFLENIYERILKYKPDFFVFIIGANDRVYITTQEFKSNLKSILSIIKAERPNCEILLITPPSGKNFEEPLLDKLPHFITDESSKVYSDIMYEVSKNYGCMFLDLIQLFKEIPIKEWRYDDVHLKKFGNTYLAKTILNMIFPNDGYYRKELVDAEFWSK